MITQQHLVKKRTYPTSYGLGGMNGDIIVMHPLTGYRHELSSMGVRVDAASIVAQLKHRGLEHEMDLPFNRAVICPAAIFLWRRHRYI